MTRWQVHEVHVGEHLAQAGAPVVPPSSDVPPGPHEALGLRLTFWRYVPTDPTLRPGPREVAALLADLHGALRGYDHELAYLGTPLADIAQFVARGRELVGLGEDDLALMRRDFERLRSLVQRMRADQRAGLQALHGDAHPGNVLHGPAGWLWADFEDTCRGPVAWDLACLARTSRYDGRAALPHYPVPVDRDQLATCINLRTLHQVIWSLLMAHSSPRIAEDAQRRLRDWRRAATRRVADGDG